MSLWRHKPLEVEVYRLTRNVESEAPAWFVDAINSERIFIDRSIVDGASVVYGCTIFTKTNVIRAKVGDYIVHDVKGEIYPCKADVFKQAFEKI